ncbi:MAG TPA: endo-1,4-beta-xylanase [Candidatus Paceibacterota bacterium]|nr:endo-1,4-beta-xylanase [Candidatus Paceibacterota bacterium]
MNDRALAKHPQFNPPLRAGRVGAAACLGLSLLLTGLGLRGATPEAYRQKWRNPALEERIGQNIEQHRKGDALLEVVDAAGKPVAGAQVALRQTTHEFLFGCNGFVLGQLGSEALNRRYEERFVQLFNFVSVPFYWAGTEPVRGQLRYEEGVTNIWRRPPPDRFVAFARRHGLTLKGHPLVWFAHNPDWLPKNPDELRALYRQRFRDIASRYRDTIPVWDVVNESIITEKQYPLYTPDRAYVGWAFDEVAPLFPKRTRLLINEIAPYNWFPAVSNRYYLQVKQLLADGRDVRGVGLQYHVMPRKELDSYLTGPNCDPARLLELYDAFGNLGVPLYITEVTFGSQGPDGEALQAEVVRDHYRLWFSVPRMAGITWWNLGDNMAVPHENATLGGLTDAELNPKPAYLVLDQLLNQEWKTRLERRTDDRGEVSFRGFFGKYEVTVAHAGKQSRFEFEHAGDGPRFHRFVLKD